MFTVNHEVKKELEEIRQRTGGFLKPSDVVKAAKKKASALHQFFEWDDTAAAQKWRIRQAQELIRVTVVVNEATSEKVRAFVSLVQDRQRGLGYRATVDVMDSEELFAVLLEDAKNELITFTRRYERLRELAELSGVFKEVDKVVKSKVKIREDKRIAV